MYHNNHIVVLDINDLKYFTVDSTLSDTTDLFEVKEDCYKFLINSLENFTYEFIPLFHGKYKVQLKQESKDLIAKLLSEFNIIPFI